MYMYETDTARTVSRDCCSERYTKPCSDRAS